MAHGSVRALPPDSLRERTRLTLQYLRYLPRTFALVRESSRAFAVGLIALLLGQAALPAAMAWVGKLIVDAVVAAARSGDSAQRWHVLRLVALEAGLMAVSTAMSRGQALLRDLMRASLGNHVNTLILEKAATLELRHFEDADFYDKMQNARREASIRPLSMALETASLLQQLLILASYAVLVARLSPWAVLLIVAASVPSFIAEARFSGESFRLNTWRAPEGRRQNYLEWILTRDSHVKEVKLFDLAPLVLRRYRALFEKFYAEDRSLALRKGAAGVVLGLVSLTAFYGAYAFMAVRAALGAITLGDLTLYLSVFRQGQTAIQSALASVGSLYEDGLFMSNLFAYLDIGTGGEQPRRLPPLSAPHTRSQEIEFRDVSFRYPGTEKWVLRGVSLKLSPGEKMALVGGQWQRIALARAFMRDSEVLVLDEPTAALDAEAEHELFVRLQQLAAERTAILISHRFSTVRRADRIAVIREGRVEELGTHAELLAHNGRYAHLFRLQASGYVS